MKTGTAILLLVLASAGFAANAEARGGHGHIHGHARHYFGGPLWWGPGFGYGFAPYYYGPRTIIIEREPPVYIQRQPSYSTPQQSSAPTAQVWFYCTDPAGYYPHVQSCTQPWVSVDPRTVTAPPTQSSQ